MVGFNRRFAPMYVQAKKNINNNTSLIRIEKHRVDSIRPEDFEITLLDDYIHLVDTARWLAEPTDCIKGSIELTDNRELIFAQHNYKSENNLNIFFDMHRKCGTNLERLEIITANSIVRVKNMNTLETEWNGKTETILSPAWETTIKVKGFEDAILHFINSILGNTKLSCDGSEALKTQQIVNDIIKQFKS